MSTTRGFLHIHSAPSALCPHIEWAVGGIFGMPMRLDWAPQPVERGSYRSEREWAGPVGSAARITSVLKAWQRVRFEVSEAATSTSESERFSYTPTLGAFRASVGPHGDVMVAEDRLKWAMSAAARGHGDLVAALDDLLGTRWDDELEPFRYAGDQTPVRWLHQVV